MALFFARTIHTIQGLTVGPDQEGKPPNAIKRMICDPGPRSFELTNPSTFYVAMTRGTTLGDAARLISAIYFCGEPTKIEKHDNKNHRSQVNIKIPKKKKMDQTSG